MSFKSKFQIFETVSQTKKHLHNVFQCHDKERSREMSTDFSFSVPLKNKIKNKRVFMRRARDERAVRGKVCSQQKRQRSVHALPTVVSPPTISWHSAIVAHQGRTALTSVRFISSPYYLSKHGMERCSGAHVMCVQPGCRGLGGGGKTARIPLTRVRNSRLCSFHRLSHRIEIRDSAIN